MNGDKTRLEARRESCIRKVWFGFERYCRTWMMKSHSCVSNTKKSPPKTERILSETSLYNSILFKLSVQVLFTFAKEEKERERAREKDTKKESERV